MLTRQRYVSPRAFTSVTAAYYFSRGFMSLRNENIRSLLPETSVAAERREVNGVHHQSCTTAKKEKQGALDLLMSAMQEVKRARRDLGWGVDEVAMRLTMLSVLRLKNKGRSGGIPREATLIGDSEASIDRIMEWERLLRWAHASYGWNERIVAQRAGVQPGEVELVRVSTGKSRGRPLAPTYVLAIDHTCQEIILSVRGTKAIGDAITISHFRPEPFLDGYAHRGFAQSAHELVREVQPLLANLRDRLPNYRIIFTGHSMGGGIAAMASMLIREDPATYCVNVDGRKASGRPTSDCVAGMADTSARSFAPPWRGPKVVSFATPACVSLELALRCRGWVESVVHADDFIPRLSTVSLELLKEDMSASDWRRFVQRLSRLGDKSSVSAEAAKKAVKQAIAGLSQSGNQTSAKTEEMSPVPDMRLAAREKKGERQDNSDEGGDVCRAQRDGFSSSDVERRRSSKNLRQSLRETLRAMHKLAELYPLSMAFRQELSTYISQVSRRVTLDPKDSRSDTFGDERLGSHRDLLSTLKAHVVRLGSSRAALRHGGAACDGRRLMRDVVTDISRGMDDAYANGQKKVQGLDDRTNGGIERGAKNHDTEPKDVANSLALLHASYSTKEEATLLPLYPPGETLLMCDAPCSPCEKEQDTKTVTDDHLSDDTSSSASEGGESAVYQHGQLVATEDGVNPVADDTRKEEMFGIAAKPSGGKGTMPSKGATIDDVLMFKKNVASTSDQLRRERQEAARNARRITIDSIDMVDEDMMQTPAKALVRVPHHHFLRMPLSATMISDHTMRSYRQALTGLRVSRGA